MNFIFILIEWCAFIGVLSIFFHCIFVHQKTKKVIGKRLQTYIDFFDNVVTKFYRIIMLSLLSFITLSIVYVGYTYPLASYGEGIDVILTVCILIFSYYYIYNLKK